MLFYLLILFSPDPREQQTRGSSCACAVWLESRARRNIPSLDDSVSSSFPFIYTSGSLFIDQRDLCAKFHMKQIITYNSNAMDETHYINCIPFFALYHANVYMYVILARRQDGDGRHFAHGRHGAVLRRAAGSHETTMDRLRSARMLRPIQ